jgi:hypothetical protein
VSGSAVDPGPCSSARQALLLEAALRRGAPALDAWRRWVDGLDPERLEEQIEPDSQWLMPLLYWNLRRDVTHPVLARCRNVYLHNWYKNNAMLHALAAAVRAEKPGVTPVLLKGAAMAVRYYESPGARPFAAIDVWRGAGADGEWVWPAHLGETLVLHDAPFPATLPDELLHRVDTVTVMGVTCAVMSAADQLVHIASQRRSWDPRTGLVWLADAAQVLRRSPGLDWDTMRATAARLGLTDALSRMLDYLERFDVPVGRPRAARSDGRSGQ